MEISVLGTQLKTTPLGYGCANLMGRLGKRESRRLLDAAFDSGIRHFDVAPLYGYGEAEGLLGEFAAGRRDRITIATKFGIRPPKRSAALTAAKSVARTIVAVFPQLRRHLRRQAEQMTRSGCFTVAECTRSLHHSLRQLRTDYIDVFLMHEITADQITPELIEALDGAKRQGLIRHYGAATTARDTIAIRSRELPAGQIAQFPNSAFENTLEQLSPLNRTATGTITHSSLGAAFKALSARLASGANFCKNWSRELGFDCSDPHNLAALLLYAAMQENSGGIVLFSSVNYHNIQRNAALLRDQTFSERQLSSVKWLLQDFLGHSNPAEIGIAS